MTKFCEECAQRACGCQVWLDFICLTWTGCQTSKNFVFHPLFPPPTTNLPAAHCSSSAPFSQSCSPSHRHDNETHLLAAPPQSNFSGGQVCRPVVRGWRWKNSEGERAQRGETGEGERKWTADEKVGGEMDGGEGGKQRGIKDEDRESKMREEIGRRQKIEREGTASQ